MSSSRKIEKDATSITRNRSFNFGLAEMLAENNGQPSETNSIRRIAIILASICNGINTLADISEQSRLSRSTVHRLLKGLEKSYLVIYDPVNRRYYLGSLFRHLIAKPQTTHEYLIACAAREMERLAAVTEETVVLAVKIGLNHAALHSISSIHELRIVPPTKMVGPLHAGAGGKVLLSQLSDAELKDTLKNIQVGSEDLPNIDQLLAQVREIRRKGYSVTVGERVFGATLIAAPVRGYQMPAALSVVGPDARMQPKLSGFVDKLLVSAGRISDNVINNQAVGARGV
jgi:DNA-binding IclR family transcriptional regulator